MKEVPPAELGNGTHCPGVACGPPVGVIGFPAAILYLTAFDAFLHGAFSNAFGLCGRDALFAGLTSSLPAVNKITFPDSIGRGEDSLGRSGTISCECMCESEPSPVKMGSLLMTAHNGNMLASVYVCAVNLGSECRFNSIRILSEASTRPRNVEYVIRSA